MPAAVATKQAGRWFSGGRNKPKTEAPLRVLTAAATRLDLTNRKESRRMRALRQGWQLEAWAYRASIGELRYAVNFLADAMARMRIFPAAYPVGGETDEPSALTEIDGVPEPILMACNQAMIDLGNGKLAISGLLHSLSTQITVPGECFLLGQEDPQTGTQSWSVRSVSEIVVYDDAYKLREVPMDPQGILGWVDLDPTLTVASRMWVPDPQFRILADSPLKAIMDDCESLLILRRMIRATGRSRLAGRGMLLIPNELSINVPNDDDDTGATDPFMSQLTEAMLEPISDEGVASSVVPMVVRGPGDTLAKVRLLEFAAQFDELSSKTREELVGIIGSGLNLPKSIVVGDAVDANHWSLWQISDDTFRQIEPHVITGVDMLTGAYLRPYIANCAADPQNAVTPEMADEWGERLVLWYDPTELVIPPDMSQSSMAAHGALIISDAAARKYGGFSEEDAPTPAEIEVRMIRTTKTYPPNLLMGLMHELDPNLVVPPISGPGIIPGIKPGGVDVPVMAVAPAAPGAPAPAVPADVTTPTPSSGSVEPGPPPITAAAFARATEDERRAIMAALRANLIASLGYDPFSDPPEPLPLPAVTERPPAAITAASTPKPTAKSLRLSRKLVAIDADLRARLTTAANSAMLRQLEKAGGRMRSKVAKDETLRTKIAHTRNEQVAAHLGEAVVTAAGLSASELMGTEWDGLKAQFYDWTAAAQKQALAAACQIAGITTEDEAASVASAKLAQSLDAGWTLLSDAMTTLSHGLLYNPDLNAADAEAFNPDTLIPTGTIRASLGVAGGATDQDFGLMTTKAGTQVPAIPLGTPVGQVGTGATLEDLITGAGGSIVGYEWIHGPSLVPFEPHEALDGVEFATFDDPVLANDGDFPQNAFYMPGDHAGCVCDFDPQYAGPGDDTGTVSDTGADSGDTGDQGE